MQRYGQTIGLRPEAVAEYDALHAAVWPSVLATIAACNVRNYSIYRIGTTLFAYFEYTGSDFAADMAKMAADRATVDWWTHTAPLQVPLAGSAPGEWWTAMTEVFHTD